MRRWTLPAAILLLLMLARPALAHGGVVVFDKNVGNYGVAVLQTAMAEERTYYYTIYLTEPDSGPPIAGANVVMVTTGPDGNSTSRTVAPEADLEGYYDESVTFPSDGTWQIDLQIDGRAGKIAASFTTNVVANSQALNLSIWALALLPIVAAAGVLLYFWIRTGRQPFTEEGVLDDEGPLETEAET